jgi:O-antigen/teichoic acid export membrane protein
MPDFNDGIMLFEKTYFSYIIKLMFIVSSFNIFISIPQSLMRLQEKSILFSLTNIIKLIVTLSLTVLLIVKFNRGLNGIYEAQLIGFIVYTILIIRYVLRNIEIQFELKILKELIIFSYPLVIATISGLILSSIDRYLLNFLICGDNLVQVGLYSLGVKITSVIKIFIINSFKLASPAIFFKQLNQENNKRFYSKVFTYFTFVLIFAALGMSLFGNELVILFTSGSSYLKATEVIPILSLSLVFLGMVNVLNYGLIIAKKTKIMSMVVFIVSLSNVLLNLFFIPILESIGAAVANLFSQILFFIIIYKFTQKHYQIPYEIVKVFKMLVVAVFIFIMSLYLSDFNIYLRSFLKLVLSLSFPLFLYFWNFYDEIELQKLKEILEKIQLKIINH